MFSTIIHMTWSVNLLWIIVASISKHRGTEIDSHKIILYNLDIIQCVTQLYKA